MGFRGTLCLLLLFAAGVCYAQNNSTASGSVFKLLDSYCFGKSSATNSSQVVGRVNVRVEANTPIPFLRIAVFSNEPQSWPVVSSSNQSCAFLIGKSLLLSDFASWNGSVATFSLSISETTSARLWYFVAASCLPTPSFNFSLSKETVSSAQVQNATCPVTGGDSSGETPGHDEHGGHGGVSKARVAIVCAFGGAVWLFLVFYTFKKTCSQPYFSIKEFISTLPSETWQKSSGGRKLRQRGHEEHEEEVQFHDNAYYAFKAMPTKFAAVLGTFGVVVATGVWMSLLLASLKIENWESYIGAAIGIFLLFCLFAYLYVKSRMKQEQERSLQDMKAEFAEAVERVKVATEHDPVKD
eukprot:TRINITY_DN3039_c0_g1_i2.p1 TRINITY_DN3039_c0_g1~~TRINITY_DN3039_c0_g1_i2.p1  ORF type:complete len:373 (+),score=95.93 TRINITY_DN3039_c0_g1_i2:59-1120(+)